MESIAYYKEKVESGEMAPIEALNEVLRLFNVCNHRQLLIAYEKWRNETDINELWTYSRVVDKFLGNTPENQQLKIKGMKLNWTTIKERKPKNHNGFKVPYISCIVFSCNPETPQGGVIETCRWDVENDCWFKSDIRTNWFLQHPYKITHFADDIEPPYTP